MTNCGYLNGKWCICAKEACYGQNVTLGGTTIKKYIKNKTSPPIPLLLLMVKAAIQAHKYINDNRTFLEKK